MANFIEEAAIRAQLHTDIAAVWSGLTRIVDGQSLAPPTQAWLPFATLSLKEVVQEAGNAGLKHILQTIRYEIRGIFALPTTNLEAERIAKANLLIDRLTDSTTYANTALNCWVARAGLDDDRISELENVYEVVVEFACEVHSSRT